MTVTCAMPVPGPIGERQATHHWPSLGVLSAAALEFCLSNTVDALQGVLLDVEVLADHFRSDACVAQSQRQGVRERQFAQRLFACAKFVGHLTSVRPWRLGLLSRPVPEFVAT